MRFKYPFLAILNDLNRLTDSLVLVGGWVPTVYFEYLWQSPRNFFRTQDVDLALTPTEFHNSNLLEREFERFSAKNSNYRKKHLQLGKEKPYQLLFDSSIPIDFLADPKDARKIRNEILGQGIILNESEGYSYLLESPLQVNCEGVLVRVPQPSRYITHKIFVYLQNQGERKKDLATAYYCITRSPDPDALLAEITLLKSTSVMERIKKQRQVFVESQSASAIRDIQKSLMTIGVDEDEEEIQKVLEQFI